VAVSRLLGFLGKVFLVVGKVLVRVGKNLMVVGNLVYGENR